MKKIDKYELPEGVIDNDEVKEELIEKLLPKLDKILEDNSDDERQKIKEYIINKIDDDTITDTTLKIVGESWQREFKKIINEAKLYVATTSKKSGKTYLSKENKKILKDLEPYHNRDKEGQSDLWFDGIYHQEYFKKLAKKYGKSVDGIKKLAQRHDPNNK